MTACVLYLIFFLLLFPPKKVLAQPQLILEKVLTLPKLFVKKYMSRPSLYRSIPSDKYCTVPQIPSREEQKFDS